MGAIEPIRLVAAETDLYQNWNRFYDASTGRYLEPEPMWLYPEKLLPTAAKGRAVPLYAYAGNNPVNSVDPDGLAPCESLACFQSSEELEAQFMSGAMDKQEQAAVAATAQLAAAQKAQISTDNPREPSSTIDVTGQSTDPATGVVVDKQYTVSKPKVEPKATDHSSEVQTYASTEATMHAHVRPEANGERPSFQDYKSATEEGRKLTMYVLTYKGVLVRIQGGTGGMSKYRADLNRFEKVSYGPTDLR